MIGMIMDQTTNAPTMATQVKAFALLNSCLKMVLVLLNFKSKHGMIGKSIQAFKQIIQTEKYKP